MSNEPAWWAEARRLREAEPGWTHEALAVRFGKSATAVRNALSPEKYREKDRRWRRKNSEKVREMKRRYRQKLKAARTAAE